MWAANPRDPEQPLWTQPPSVPASSQPSGKASDECYQLLALRTMTPCAPGLPHVGAAKEVQVQKLGPAAQGILLSGTNL